MTDSLPGWLARYFELLGNQDLSRAPRVGPKFLCPCCSFPTLDERAAFEICLVCWWEDDGQGDDIAELALPGPNSGYSLREARENFKAHLHMYKLGQGIDVVESPNAERLEMLSYAKDVMSGSVELNPEIFADLLKRVRDADE